MENFRKLNLGDKVIYRKKSIGVVVSIDTKYRTFVTVELFTGFRFTFNFKSNIYNSDNTVSEQDIIKVERLQPAGYNKYSFKTLWEELEQPKEILDLKEKEYLRAVIKPFRKRVKYIVLKSNYDIIEDKYDYFIRVKLNDNDSIPLPYFKKDTMYKGMEEDREYSLKELGL